MFAGSATMLAASRCGRPRLPLRPPSAHADSTRALPHVNERPRAQRTEPSYKASFGKGTHRGATRVAVRPFREDHLLRDSIGRKVGQQRLSSEGRDESGGGFWGGGSAMGLGPWRAAWIARLWAARLYPSDAARRAGRSALASHTMTTRMRTREHDPTNLASGPLLAGT